MKDRGFESVVKLQGERMKRFEEALPNGDYRLETFVDSDDVEVALETASSLVAEHERSLVLNGLQRVLKGAGRLIRPTTEDMAVSRMLGLARQVPTGNIGLASVEMDMGLFEPFEGAELALHMARRIVTGDYQTFNADE